jgi:hypothetical protein
VALFLHVLRLPFSLLTSRGCRAIQGAAGTRAWRLLESLGWTRGLQRNPLVNKGFLGWGGYCYRGGWVLLSWGLGTVIVGVGYCYRGAADVLAPDQKRPVLARLRLDGHAIEAPSRVDQASLADQLARILVAVPCNRAASAYQHKRPVGAIWVVVVANHPAQVADVVSNVYALHMQHVWLPILANPCTDDQPLDGWRRLPITSHVRSAIKNVRKDAHGSLPAPTCLDEHRRL